jgi:hypothetical protein
MTDIQILLVIAVVTAVFWGYLELCDRVRG